MSIRLKWLNRNTVFDSVIIYRSLDPINLDALPAPLVTLTNGEKEYLDTTAPKAKLLWYAFGVKKGTEIVYSKSKPMMDVDYTGPGPQEIALGNWFQGYFGIIEQVDLVTSADLVGKFGVGNVSSTGIRWHKFAYMGKVLYIPSAVAASGVSWNALYNRGLVFGVNDVGPTGHGNPPTNQWQTIVKGDDQLLVRLPRSNLTPDYVMGTTDPYSEWFMCVHTLSGLSQAKGLSQAQAIAALGPDNSWFALNASAAPFAEFQNNGALTGGSNYVNANSITWGTNALGAARSSNGVWRPVLEYVFPY